MSIPLLFDVTLPNGVKFTQPTGLFINNEFVPSKSGKTLNQLIHQLVKSMEKYMLLMLMILILPLKLLRKHLRHGRKSVVLKEVNIYSNLLNF